MPDQGQRTEKPTKRKLDKARREGPVPLQPRIAGSVAVPDLSCLLGAGGLGFLERVRVLARHFLEGRLSGPITQHSVPILYRQSVG